MVSYLLETQLQSRASRRAWTRNGRKRFADSGDVFTVYLQTAMAKQASCSIRLICVMVHTKHRGSEQCEGYIVLC